MRIQGFSGTAAEIREAVGQSVLMTGITVEQLSTGIPHIRVEPLIGDGLLWTNDTGETVGPHTLDVSRLSVKLGTGLSFDGSGAIQTTGTAGVTSLGGATGALTLASGLSMAGTVLTLDADLSAIAALAGTSGLLRKTAADTWTLDTATYLTANQTITLSGEASGTGTTAITVTLANSAVIGKVLTGYAVGADTALAATDTILAAFQKVQGQLNAKAVSTRTLTINGTTGEVEVTGGGQTLAADRTWTIGLPSDVDITTSLDIGNVTGLTASALRVGGDVRASGTIYATDFVLTGGAGSGTGITLDNLSDVVITAAATGDYLRYNGTNWVDAPIQTSDLGSGTANTTTFLRGDRTWASASLVGVLDDLTDVVIATPSNGQVLRHNGTNWANATLAASDVSALSSSTSSTQSGYFGDIYLWDDATPSHYLQITNSANLTLARTLSINVNDANRTVNLSGDLTVSSAATISGTNTGDQTITLTGDITGTGTGSFATTLATVNSNVGSFGAASTVPIITVNAKGLVTAVSTAAVVAPAGTLSGATLAAGVTASSLTSLGTLTALNVTGATSLVGSATIRAAATQDGIILAGRAGGTSSWDVTISPTTLTADRTLTLADGNTILVAGTMVPTTVTLTIANGTGITGGSAAVDLSANRSWTIGLTGQALAIHNLATTGVVARTGAATFATRTITGTANQITVTNGDGVAGNPTLSLPVDVDITTSLDVGNVTGITAAMVRIQNDLRVGGTIYATDFVLTGGAGSGTGITLDNLSDVVITAAATGDFLRFNGTNWVDDTIQNSDLGTGTANSTTFLRGDRTWAVASLVGVLDDLTDVTITTPSSNQILQYNGSQWVNVTAPYLSTSASSTQAGYFGDIYLWDDSTPSHYLQITNSANLTLARILSINVNDADRTISLSGNLTVSAAATISGTNTGDQTITLTGDVTGSGTGSFAATLATVNSNVGTFGAASTVPVITVNGKGLITAVTTATVVAPAGTLTGATLASGVTASSLTSLGTLTALNVAGATSLVGSLTVRAAATQDGVILAGRAGGTLSYDVTISPTTLTADRTLTLADGNTILVAGTMVPTTVTLTIANGTGITGGGAAVDLSTNRSWTIGLAGQALALHNLATSGLVARTAADTFAARTITGTTNQVTVSNGDGVAGNPTLSLPQNIHTAATPTFAGMTVTGGTVAVRAAASQDGVILQGRAGGTLSYAVTLTPTTLTASRTVTLADGNTTLVAGTMVPTTVTLTIANGTGITGGGAAVDLSANRSWTIGLTGQALAIHNLATTGLVARTGAATFATRTITGTAGEITVTNGDGVAGNPTLSLPADVNITTTLDVGSVGAIAAAMVRVGGDIRASGTIYATDFVLTGGAGSGTGITLDNLSDVVITAAATGDFLRFNGTNWVDETIQNSDLGSGTANSTTFLRGDRTWAVASLVGVLDDLTDVVITTPANGHILQHNGTNWVNVASAFLSNSASSTQAGYFGDIYLWDDSTPSHYLQITNSANLTLARVLSINVNDADRTISLSGNLTVSSAATVSGTNTGDQTITLTGDVTGTGTGSFAATLATVNSNVGSFGAASTVPVITVNAKGLVTAVSTAAVVAPAGTLSGATLAAGVTASSLTSLGTLSALNVTGATSLVGSLTVRAAATQDGIILAGRVGGTLSYDVTISPTTLTADRTLTLADANTTLVGGTMVATTRAITINGTANQITSSAGSQDLSADRTWTLSLPQNIHTGATPTFAGLTLTGSASVTGTVTAIAAATQDAVRLQGRAGGTGSFIVTLTPTTLTASRTITLADGDVTLVAGTMVPTTRTLTIANGTGITGGSAAVDLSANRSWTIALTGQALALHNLATSGLVARTAADTFAARTITGTTNQVTVSNGDGIAGNPTLSLPQNIHTAATPTFGGLTLTGSASVTGTVTAIVAATQDAVRLQGRAGGTLSYVVTLTPTTLTASRTVTLADGDTILVAGTMVPTTRTLTIANGTGITGGAAAVDLSANRSWTIGLTGQALAIHNLATTGLVARTAADTFATRTITGTANQVTVTNGDGVAGNPTLSLPVDVDITTSLDVGNVTGITAAMVRIQNDLRVGGTIYATDFVLTGGAGSGTGISLDNLNDVVITAAATGEYLRYNGTNWVDSTIQAGDVPTLNQNTTGSAATLTTTRTIWGQNFNGSANVTGAISGITTLDASGAITHTGTTASLTQSATSANLYVGNGTGSGGSQIYVRSAAGQYAQMIWATGTLARWTIYKDINAESGSNAGSTLRFGAHDDAGTFIDNWLNVTRAAAGGISFATNRPITAGTYNGQTISSTASFTGTVTVAGLLLTAASVVGGAGLRLPHGTAPTTPTNGDVWTTTAGFYVQVNGSTIGPIGTGGSITISDDTATNATRYVVFEDVTSGTSSTMQVSSTKLTFNPSSGLLSATSLAGTITTATQNSVTTMTGLTTIGTLVAGTVPAARVSAGTFQAGAYTFSSTAASVLTVSTSLATTGDQTLALFSSNAASQNTLFQIHNTNASGIASLEVGATAAGAVRGRFTSNGGTGELYFGTFSAHPLGLVVGSSARWWINTSYHLYPATDNVYDLGLSGTRLRDGYFAGTVTAGTFSGSGASLTSLNATNLSSGTVAMARLLRTGSSDLVMTGYARPGAAGDLNSSTYIEGGVYGLFGAPTNAPSGASYDTLLVIRNASDVISQLYIPRQTGAAMAYRGATLSGTWAYTSWRTVVDVESTQTISGAKSFSTFIALSNVGSDKKLQFQRTGGNQHSFELTASLFGLYNETATTWRWVVTNAGDMAIGATSVANGAKLDVVGKIRAGSATATNGSVLIENQYGTGAIALWGSNYSSGGPIMAYAAKPSTTTTNVFVSASGATLSRGAYTIDGSVHRWFTGASQTVAIDGALTMTERMTLSEAGLLSVGSASVSGQTLLGLGTHATGSPGVTMGGSAIALVLAENMTNITTKNSRIGFASYTNAEEAIIGMAMLVTASNNTLTLGGGYASGNAATNLEVYTAATNTTLSGTLRLSLSGAAWTFYSATMTGITTLDASTSVTTPILTSSAAMTVRTTGAVDLTFQRNSVTTMTVVANGVQVNSASLGVNTAPNATDGMIHALDDIVAFSSDRRLKTAVTVLDGALAKIMTLTAMTFQWNALAHAQAGFNTTKRYVGLFAQQVQAVLPEAVALAPFDNDGRDNSISGEHYLTVQYEKVVPLLVAGQQEAFQLIMTVQNRVARIEERIEQLEHELAQLKGAK